MAKVAFVGLGIMGLPMASNLVRSGFDVHGYDRNPGAIERLVEAGGERAVGVADAVQGADVIATMLPDSPDVEAVVAGNDGVLAHAAPNALLIDFSTIRPDTAKTLEALARDRGLRMLDAPVSGGQQGAIDATLSIMVGGAELDFEAAAPVLNAVGKTVVHVGPSASGQTVKAANQLIVAGTIELVAEAIVFLEAYGVDTEAAIKVLAGGLAGNSILDRKAGSMVARNFEPGFRIALHHKDLGIAMSAARDARVATPLGAVVAQLIGAMNAQGYGDLDHTALLAQVEQLSGRAER